MVDNFKIFFDVPLILVLLTLLTGLLALLDIFYFSKKRAVSQKIPLVFDCARSFFPIILIILLIRSFIVQPYRVPTGSLAPTILPGDFIIVNQYAYGLRLPVLNVKFLEVGSPQRGDLALFRFPEDNQTIFVKRVIGLPGDRVEYKNKLLTVNGKVMTQFTAGMDTDIEQGIPIPVRVKFEHLDNKIHKIFNRPGYRTWESIDVVVPDNAYFVMGDNRDNSNDSREWGFVPEQNLIGKAFGVWMSWDSYKHKVRWDRIGNRLE